MKISGILVLFPITIFVSFFVMQKQTMMEKPFERHAGAYTDLGHLISSIKNASRPVDSIRKVIPATVPRRQEGPRQIEIKKNEPMTIELATHQVEPVQMTNTKNQLEEIWRDHISSAQAGMQKESSEIPSNQMQASAGVSISSNQAGLLSPKQPSEIEMVRALAQAKPKSVNDRSNENLQNYARLDVMVVGVDINQAKSQSTVENIEFTYFADEQIETSENGRFTFEYQLARQRQTLVGLFQAKDFVPTRVDLPLEVGAYGSLVPMISISSMENLLRSNDINVPGGFILVDLDQNIIDTEIDKKYYKKLYLDSEFKLTDADDSARFVLFAGVEVGNVTLRYLTQSRNISTRISLVAADQILYDLPVITDSSVHSFGLFEMESLSLLPRELSIAGKNIRSFGHKNTAIQDTLNYYSLDFIEGVLGARRYTEIDHLGTTFFVGHEQQEKIVIPGQGFLNEVLAFHNIDRLELDCLVQINIPKDKELFEISMRGEGSKGPLLLDASYLNRDGTVSEDATEFTTNAFVLGDMLGRINIKIKYTDDSIDTLSSVCAPATYLVEHL